MVYKKSNKKLTFLTWFRYNLNEGVAVPCFLFGLILIGTGAGVALRTAGRITAIERDFERMPANLVKKELPRMQNVNAIFRLTFYAFGILAVVGLAILI